MEYGNVQQKGPEDTPLLGSNGRQESHYSASNELISVPQKPATLAQTLNRRNLPTNLKRRLLKDSEGGMPHYRRIASVNEINALKPNASYLSSTIACMTCNSAILVDRGQLGRYRNNDDFHFLLPGYHSYSSFGSEILSTVSVQHFNRPVTNGGPGGFITISEECIGVMVVSGEYRLLAPGVYEWYTAAVTSIEAKDIRNNSVVALGPYTLLTVNVGDAAVTYNHGTLRVLGGDEGNAYVEGELKHRSESMDAGSKDHQQHEEVNNSRTFFLDDPRWRFENYLSLRRQTDKLENNDLLSKDNVEVVLTAMAQWRIVDAQLCATACAADMRRVADKVDSLVRATIARIVASSALGQGPVSGATATNVGVPQKSSEEDDATLAHVMLSEQAIGHMNELKSHMNRLGIEVFGVYIPEKRIKSDNTRRAVASQAVIGIQAEQQRSSADAKAYATTVAAKAEAESIKLISEAHKSAGDMLGQADSTGAKLALAQQTGKVLGPESKVTIFTQKTGDLPYLLAPTDEDKK